MTGTHAIHLLNHRTDECIAGETFVKFVQIQIKVVSVSDFFDKLFDKIL